MPVYHAYTALNNYAQFTGPVETELFKQQNKSNNLINKNNKKKKEL